PTVLVFVPSHLGAITPADEEMAQELGAYVENGPADFVWATTSGEENQGYIFSWKPEDECQVTAVPKASDLGESSAGESPSRALKADPLKFKELQSEFDELHEKIYAAREPIDGSNDLTAQLCKLIFLKMHLERHPDFRVDGSPLFEEVFDASYIREHKERAVDEIKKAFSVAKDLEEYNAVDDQGESFQIFDQDDFIKFRNPETYALIAEMLNKHHLTDPEHTGVEDDVLGRAFDVMLRGKFEGKGGMGVYLTPQQVRDSMVQMAFHDILKEDAGILTRKDDSGKTLFHVGDPCCGSAGFLVTAMREVRRHVNKLLGLSEEQKAKLLSEIYSEGFVGCDNSPNMVLMARINMALHGDPKARVFRTDNSLTTTRLSPESYDLIVTNPPFKKGGVTAKDNEEILNAFQSDIEDQEPQYASDALALGAKPNSKGKWLPVKSIDPAVLFIDRCLQLLKPGGRLLAVLPDGILCNSGDRYVREYLMGRKDEETGRFIGGKAVVKAVVSLPPVTFRLSGAGAKTSFLYLQKKRVGDEQGPVFMAVADEVGFDVKANKEVLLGPERNDLVSIVESYKKGQPEEAE
ncbi:MAG: N-6 DNA methylase, partial [Verrucomicrobiales bacterium]|nr:N-6 DNA methylase [Verrucomicrobiales bacterium]